METPKGKVKVTRTVTLVTFEDKSAYFDGPESDRRYWSDDEIKEYLHSRAGLPGSVVEMCEEIVLNIGAIDFVPRTSEREWDKPYGDYSVTVQTDKPEPLSAEVAYLIKDANS